jgi:hypothetical protein
VDRSPRIQQLKVILLRKLKVKLQHYFLIAQPPGIQTYSIITSVDMRRLDIGLEAMPLQFSTAQR